MREKLAMKDTFRFDKPGSIARPGPIGRVLRLSFGVLCLWLVWQLVTRSTSADLYKPSFWFLAAFGFMLAPYVVNIGFGVKWGVWPRVVSAAGIIAVAAIAFATTDTVFGELLWTTFFIWMIYIYSHLGISFVLAAILATPGCEMRAIPHFLGIVLRNEAREHYCPGFIENIDEWERNRKNPADMAGGFASRDLLRNAGGQLLVYGIPFAALQVAGNLAGFLIATAVPAVAFLVVGVICLINAWRSRRVHCYFMGPWCLVVGTMTALYSFRIIDFGPSSWSLIVNTGLAGAAIIYMATERIWGKYFDHQ